MYHYLTQLTCVSGFHDSRVIPSWVTHLVKVAVPYLVRTIMCIECALLIRQTIVDFLVLGRLSETLLQHEEEQKSFYYILVHISGTKCPMIMLQVPL